MPFFFARLVPNRADFPQEMTPEEGATMQRHAAFLGEQLAKGALVVAGPVVDPAGVYGMAVIEAASLDEARALLASDPANALGRYELFAMASAVARPAPR